MNQALPAAFVKRVENDPFLGTELIKALDTTPPTSVRVHSEKYRNNLTNTHAIPWSKNGLFLSERPVFTLDPHFHAGAYYPQEAGSQLLDSVLRSLSLPLHPVVLDLCAAPGGKSTLIADFLNGRGLLVSNEIIPGRARILKENLTKWGANNTLVCNNDPEQIGNLGAIFDCLVIDAPCSGEGMFRKDHGARKEWSEGNVALCVERQRKIVMDCWDSLKSDGYLIYSTCTFNREENEDSIQWIMAQMGAEIVQINLPFAQKDREGYGYYALPSKLDTEGFYIAVLQKKESTRPAKLTVKKPTTHRFTDQKLIENWGRFDQLAIVQWSNYLFAIPEMFTEIIAYLHAELRMLKMGTELGEISRKGLIPNESLALAHLILDPGIQRIALNLEQALHYLHGDTFPLAGQVGFAVVTYDGSSLGWIKHLGNRFNNLYPKEWRIRMRID